MSARFLKLRNALAVVGAMAIVLVVAGTAMLIGSIERGFRATDPPSALERVLAQTLRHLSVPRRERTQKNPLPVDEKLLAAGRAHFADHCASCHANNGSGDTPLGKNLYPPAPDMRLPETQNRHDGELFYAIKHGIRLTGMPAWGGADDDAETWSLVAFIRHLPAISQAELSEMEKLNPMSAHEMNEVKEEAEFLKGPSPQHGSSP